MNELKSIDSINYDIRVGVQEEATIDTSQESNQP